MSDPIDLRRMRHVLEVARAGAITTAAETLGMTQSALSRSITEVEEAVGLPLFDRLPRGIRPTEAGQRFVEGARRLLGDLDGLIEYVREPRTLLAGRLRIAVAPSGYVHHVGHAVREIVRLHPGIRIEVGTGSVPDLCPRLINGEFDIIVGLNLYLERWRELSVRRVKAMHMACAVRHDHPLTRCAQPAGEADLLAYPFVTVRSMDTPHSVLAERFAAWGRPFEPRYVVDDIDLMLALVGRTDAVCLMQSPYRDFRGLASVALLRDALAVEDHHISIAYARNGPRSAAARRFEMLLAEHYAQVA